MIEEILSTYGVEPAVISMIAGLLFVFIIIAIAAYIYMAIALQTTAKKLKAKNSWYAWIPILNLVLLASMAKMHWWPVLLIFAGFIPIIGQFAGLALLVFSTIWTWKVCVARKQPGWLSLFVFVPFIGGLWQLILWGILAWSDKPLVK